MEMIQVAELAISSAQLVKLLRGQSKDSRDKRAMVALYESVDATGRYLAEWQNGTVRNRSRERTLANSWRNAANAMMSIDPDLANRLRVKGDYWLNPDEWTQKWVDSQRIGFESVRAELDALMKASG